MKITRITNAETGFVVTETTARSQHAIMNLDPGESSGEKPSTHPQSDQTLVVLEGTVAAEIAGEQRELVAGDAVCVVAGTPHKFTNVGKERAVTFSVYSPPAYPAGGSGRQKQ